VVEETFDNAKGRKDCSWMSGWFITHDPRKCIYTPPLPLAGEGWGEGGYDLGRYPPSPLSSPPWGEEVIRIYFLSNRSAFLLS